MSCITIIDTIIMNILTYTHTTPIHTIQTHTHGLHNIYRGDADVLTEKERLVLEEKVKIHFFAHSLSVRTMLVCTRF
jgi:hypothetical protein